MKLVAIMAFLGVALAKKKPTPSPAPPVFNTDTTTFSHLDSAINFVYLPFYAWLLITLIPIMVVDHAHGGVFALYTNANQTDDYGFNLTNGVPKNHEDWAWE